MRAAPRENQKRAKAVKRPAMPEPMRRKDRNPEKKAKTVKKKPIR